MRQIFFVIPGIVFLILFLRIRIRRPCGASLLLKGLTSVCFLAAALCGTWAARTGPYAGFAFLVTAGLFFGLLGDLWLDLKWNCPGEDTLYTYAGFVSFAVGHVFFLIALIRYFGSGIPAMRIVIPLILAAVLGAAVGFAGPLLHLSYGRFRTITMIYGALLIGTTLVSGSLLLSHGFRTRTLLLFFIGAVLFLISDLILSGTYFGEGKNRPVDIAANHAAYYAAQFLIALSISALF